MRGKEKKHGHYELFETTKGHQILNLGDDGFYALVEGQQGDIIVHSDPDHEKKKTIQQGTYYLADFEDDPEFRDVPHLFLENGENYDEMILPNGLPTSSDHQRKLVRTDMRISGSKIKEHVEGKGNKGSERQYQGKEEGLRNKTKDELYEKAQKEGLQGRSKMDKEELVQQLKKDR